MPSKNPLSAGRDPETISETVDLVQPLRAGPVMETLPLTGTDALQPMCVARAALKAVAIALADSPEVATTVT